MILSSVKTFIETNYKLLDSSQTDFFMSAYNGLSTMQMKELVDVLTTAGIDTQKARETCLRFVITMDLEVIEKPVQLNAYVARNLHNIFGFDDTFVCNYIMDNISEWDNPIKEVDRRIYIYPAVQEDDI